MVMTSVRHILRTKGAEVLVVEPALAVRDALRLMRRSNVGSLLVVEDGRLVGLFTERDFAWHVADAGPSSLEGAVRDVMTRRVLVVSPTTAIDECMALMTDKRTRHLPVVEDDELVGIVSIGDIVKGLIDEREFVIEQLERYITGR
jgi:CBS domain-containing protein